MDQFHLSVEKLNGSINRNNTIQGFEARADPYEYYAFNNEKDFRITDVKTAKNLK